MFCAQQKALIHTQFENRFREMSHITIHPYIKYKLLHIKREYPEPLSKEKKQRFRNEMLDVLQHPAMKKDMAVFCIKYIERVADWNVL